ncbi:MAG: hypothetical protein Aurels2KO_15000 [Aureliella sp.]
MLGADGIIDTVEGTTIHPIWSLDRNDWVPLGELTEGEQLLGSARTAIILTHTIFHRTTPVYNIEVHGHHVYQVGAFGVLVHNSAEDCIVGAKGAASFADEIVNINKATDGAGELMLGKSPLSALQSASYYDGAALRAFAESGGLKITKSHDELMDVATRVATGELSDIADIVRALR